MTDDRNRNSYVVGQVHPASSRRQFHQLEESELIDLCDVLVHHLVEALKRLNVAGAERADTWALAAELRHLVTERHEAAFRRHLAQQLERG